MAAQMLVDKHDGAWRRATVSALGYLLSEVALHAFLLQRVLAGSLEGTLLLL